MTARKLVVAAVVAAGLLCSLDRWGWVQVLVFSLICATVVSLAVAALTVTEGRVRGRRATELGLSATAWVVGGGGLVATFGWIGMTVVLALAATSAPVLLRLRTSARSAGGAVRRLETEERRSRGSDRGARPETGDELVRGTGSEGGGPPPVPDVRPLDDAALCRAWQQSYFRLVSAETTAARLAVVRERQAYLDELQRRHAGVFASWLAGCPRASASPLRHLREARRQHGSG